MPRLSNYAKNALVLGLLAAVGPFSIDMYLPALPTIAASLRASTGATQMTLTVSFAAFGICQIIYGPVSDMAGRKPPLYFGLGLFILGSVGCALSPDIGSLIACRFVQGVGASAVMVIPRAIIRDLHTGIEATRLMSFVMLVLSVSPILAPLTGSTLIVPFGWRAVFVALTIVATLGFALVTFSLPETRPKEKRVAVSIGHVLVGFGRLLTNARFLGLTFIGALGTSSFFVFLANSSFVYIEHFGLSPRQFGLAFSVNAAGFIGASQFAATLGTRYGMGRVVMAAAAAYAFFALSLLALTLAGLTSLPVLIVMLFMTFTVLGLVVPATMVLALDDHGKIAGLASALGGTLQMVTGGLTIVIASLFFDGTARPMVVTIASCAAAAFALSAATLNRRAARPQLAE
jgi:DHA1 family bicyclomycin/chloramphenicol resistance-like MFS transporter